MAHLLPTLKQQFLDANGAPLVGGKIYTYLASTTTPHATYTDESENTANTNPIILDANGEADIWVDSSSYKFVVKDSNDVTLRTIDKVYFIADGSINKDKLSSDIAGNGLSQNVDNSLQVNVDGTTIEISSDSLRIKASGISTAKIADSAVTTAKIDPAIDLTGITNAIEVIFRNPGDFSSNSNITGLPQFPWSTPTKLTNPSTLPASDSRSAKWSPNGEYLAVAHLNSPFVTIYQRRDVSGAGFIKISDPGTLPAGNAFGVDWSPNGEFLAVAHSTSPFVTIYQRSNSTFTKLSNPGTLPAGAANAIAWSKNGEFLAVAHSTSPYITIYQRSGTTFTKLTDPGTLPAGIGNGVSWSNNSIHGEFLAVAHASSPFVTIYQRQGASLTFTKLSDPATLPASDGYGVAFSNRSDFLAVAHDTTPFVTIYQRSGTTFTKLTDPGTLPAANARGVSWSPNNKYLAVVYLTTSPYITIYQRSGTTFTKLTDPGTLPNGLARGVDWSPTNELLAVAHDTSPKLTIYKTSSSMPTNAILYVKDVPNV